MNTKNRQNRQIAEEAIEAKPQSGRVKPAAENEEIKNLWREIINTGKQELLEDLGKSIERQVFGGPLEEGQAAFLKQIEQTKEEMKGATKVSAEHMEYFRTVQDAEKYGDARTEREIKQAVDQIRQEIQKLIKTSKLVERIVKDATIDAAPVKPGKYHITFFEFVLGVIRDATRELEDAAHYGTVFTSRKQQSKYWSAYKRFGTMFGLSGERTVATQTG